MNFEAVEGLNEESVVDLYNNIVENDEKLSYKTTYALCKADCLCEDGKKRAAYFYNERLISEGHYYRGYAQSIGFGIGCAPLNTGHYGISGQCSTNYVREYVLWCNRLNADEDFETYNFVCQANCVCQDGRTTVAYFYNERLTSEGHYYRGYARSIGLGVGCAPLNTGHYGISGQCSTNYVTEYVNYCM